MAINGNNKAIAEYLHETIGGHAIVYPHSDEAKAKYISVMHITDWSPTQCIAATVGLSDYSIGLEVDGKHLGVEIVGGHLSDQPEGPDILASCAFNLISSDLTIRPGVIHRDVIEKYRRRSLMKHVLFSSPFLWPLESLTFDNKIAAFLHAVPISEAECAYALENGSEALAAVLEAHSVDVFNLDRRSVL